MPKMQLYYCSILNSQTTKELKAIVGRDHQLLNLYINIQQDIRHLKPSNGFYPKSGEKKKKHGTYMYLHA